MNTLSWQPLDPCSNNPGGPGAAVHLWQASFSAWEVESTRLAQHLNHEERERMRRFRDPGLAARYLIGRGLLRELLGKYMGAAPAEVQIAVNDHGKPELPGSGGRPLHFNLAHTDGIALYGFTGLCPIGVDVEGIAPGRPDPLEARRILSDEEWAAWQALPEGEQSLLFCQTWTRKEAILKALGVGLSIEPDTFAVGFAPRPLIVRLEATRLCVRDLSVNESVKAALALTEVSRPQVFCFTALPV